MDLCQAIYADTRIKHKWPTAIVVTAILLTLDAAVYAATTCEPNTLTAAWKIIVPIAVIE